MSSSSRKCCLRRELTGGTIQIVFTLLFMTGEIVHILHTSTCTTQPGPPHTHTHTVTHLDKRTGCHHDSFHLFLMSVVGQRAERPSGGSDWETNRNQKPVGWGVPWGVIHFLLTFLFYVFFSQSVSLWWRCAESDSPKMVLAPKLNLLHKHHRADCLLAGAGCFALEKQIQTRNTLLVLWTASNKAAFTLLPWKQKTQVFVELTGTYLFVRQKKVAVMKVLDCLSVFSWGSLCH